LPVNFELRQGAGCAFRGFVAVAFFDQLQLDIGDGAIKHQLTLVHNDRDFETIQRARSLNCLRFRPENN